MAYTNITQATKQFGLSTRTLRYYEQIGLIKSERADDYAYRVYSDDTLNRLRQIIVLRKLRIPLKSIAEILTNADATKALDIFMKSISEIDTEITALSTIRDILRQLTEKLSESVHLGKRLDFFSEDIIGIADTLAVVKPKIKEENTMSELNTASEKLEKLTDRDVRIIYLPPMTMATCKHEGDNPEDYVTEKLQKFIHDTDLLKVKPDIRCFGYNIDVTGVHAYEQWVSIPDDWEVPEPLVKKTFNGGMYAAHMIPFGAFEEWGWLDHWMHNNKRYEYNGEGKAENMYGFLEETLNYPSHITASESGKKPALQLDLMVPIKEKA